MKMLIQKGVGFIASLMLLAGLARADEIKVGMPAPDFELMDQQGKVQALESYRGKWVVLYFYPKDDTPGCTKEACHFRDDIFLLKKVGAQVLGVSIDTRESHKKFAEKYSLPFPLLADVKGKVAETYGSLWSLGPIRFARRHTFIVDPEGNVGKIYRRVDSDTHSQQIINDLKALQKSQ